MWDQSQTPAQLSPSIALFLANLNLPHELDKFVELNRTVSVDVDRLDKISQLLFTQGAPGIHQSRLYFGD